MAPVVTARHKWVNCLAEGWVDSLAEIPLKWVVCLAVDTMLGIVTPYERSVQSFIPTNC